MKKTGLLLCFFVSNHLIAQNVTGSWFGQADVEMSGYHSNYLTELIIKQKGDEIEGIFGYYFKDVYQSFFIHGTYNAKTKEITIQDIPVIYYGTNSTVNSIECNTDFIGTFFTSALQRKINGHFYHDGKYKYTCPDLRVTYTIDTSENTNETLANAVAGKQVWKPQPDDFVVSANESKKEEINFEEIKKNKKISIDGPPLKTTDVTPLKEASDVKKITEAYAKRKNIYNKDLLIESDSVKVT